MEVEPCDRTRGGVDVQSLYPLHTVKTTKAAIIISSITTGNTNGERITEFRDEEDHKIVEYNSIQLYEVTCPE